MSQRFPQTPALAFVSKQVRHEILPVLSRENIFLFSLSKEHSKWQKLALYDRPLYRTLENSVPSEREAVRARATLANLWTVRLEFCLETPIGFNTGNDDQYFNARCTWVDIKLDKQGKLQISFTGALVELCTCRLLTYAARWGPKHDQYQDRVVSFDSIDPYASFIEEEISGI